MRIILTVVMALFASVAQADFLSDHQGTWEGQGKTDTGIPFTYYARVYPDVAMWHSVPDGCEGAWEFTEVHAATALGWERVDVGQDRCYVGLQVYLEAVGDGRFRAEWTTMHGLPVAEATFLPVQ